MNTSTGKKVDRGGLIAWSIFAGLFIFAGISKYGPLLAYLKVSGYLSLFLAVYMTHKANEKLDEKIRGRPKERYAKFQRIRLMKSALVVAVFFVLIYLLFFVQPDKLAIAYVKNIPIEALYPCSNQPLDPEIEWTAREIFRLREIDKFDHNYCNSGE